MLLKSFWCGCFKAKTDYNVSMPSYFCFLALLGFKIFAAEQVIRSLYIVLMMIEVYNLIVNGSFGEHERRCYEF